MTYLRYHNQTGEILAQLQCDPATIHTLATEGTGLIEGNVIVADYWVNGDQLEPREDAVISISPVPLAPGNSPVVIMSDLPTDCWVRVRGTDNMPFEAQTIPATNGKISLVPAIAGRYVIQPVGQYRSPEITLEVLPLEVVKARRQAEVSAKKAEQLSGGFLWNGHRWDADAAAQATLTSMASAVAAGMVLPDGFFWTSYDNQDVEIDGAGISALSTALMAFIFATHAYARSLKESVDAQDNIQDIMGLKLSQSWPT